MKQSQINLTTFRTLCIVVLLALPALAFAQIGNPATCVLCNEPPTVQHLREQGVEVYPVIHLDEGDVGAAEKIVEHWKNKWVKQEFHGINYVDAEDSTAYESYYFKDPVSRVLYQSTEDVIRFTSASLIESIPWQVFTPREFKISFQAGLPGRTSVAWILASARKQHLSDKTDFTTVSFLQPVVVHVSPVTISEKEMVVAPYVELKFLLQYQGIYERARKLGGDCNITIDGAPYQSSNRTPHLLKEGRRNCGVLVSLSGPKGQEYHRVIVTVIDPLLVKEAQQHFKIPDQGGNKLIAPK